MIRLEMKSYNLILVEKQQKYQHYHVEKLINMNILQLKKYYFLIKARCTYSSLGKALEKQIKPIEDQEEKQIKVIENREKQLVESDKIVKKDFNVDRESGPLEEQKNI